MNKDLLEALAHLMLAEKAMKRANAVLYVDDALAETRRAIAGVQDDIELEGKRLNVRVMPVRVVA